MYTLKSQTTSVEAKVKAGDIAQINTYTHIAQNCPRIKRVGYTWAVPTFVKCQRKRHVLVMQ